MTKILNARGAGVQVFGMSPKRCGADKASCMIAAEGFGGQVSAVIIFAGQPFIFSLQQISFFGRRCTSLFPLPAHEKLDASRWIDGLIF